MRSAKLLGTSKGSDGKVVGSYNEKLVFNSLMYDVEFYDDGMK